MCIETLFIIIKKQKPPRCPLSNEWINKMWYIYVMEHYSVTERNVKLIYATMWVNLENMLGDRGQIQKNTYCIDSI